ncbi:MAG: tRNA (adenosine(37)-N6)-dimethylallyltransferase MiaA [Acidobacteria bacterium]|nr:MAG: tRNA (adenosine(37)-N6)-dimethylallyltransferase MiaA [Acidobacteriota bacterium]
MVDEVVRDYPLIAIAGPTASGKSELAVFLAARLGGEVVSYDSVQFYRGFDVGTGKLTLSERKGIPHHLLDCLDPSEPFTAGDFRREAARVIEGIRKRGNLPVLAGGTGLYLRALLMGLFEGPPRSEKLRARLRALADRRGREFVHRLLGRLDPVSARRVGPRDLQKVIRAVEVCLVARRAFSVLQARGREPLAGYQCFKIGLNPDREDLYARINRRVEKMFVEGLEVEVRRMLLRPDAEAIKGLGSLGYRQAAAAVRGEISQDEAVRDTQAATRHYAKRQMTWFRREAEMNWFSGFGDDPALQGQVLDALKAWFASKFNEAPFLQKVVSL